MARPSDLPKWNETEERVLAPNTTQEQTGFVWSGTKFEKPKGELFNYLLNNTYKWIKHFDEDGVNTKLFDVASGTANAITLTIPSITSYEENTVFMFKATADNTGATTVNVNSLGAIAVVINNVALTAGQIENGKEYFLRYSSNSNFELVAVGGGELDISGLPSKTTPTGNDSFVIADSASSNELKNLTLTNLVSKIAGTTTGGLNDSSGVLSFYPYGLTTATTELTTSDYVVVSDSTTPKKITLSNFANELPLLGVGQTWQDVTASRSAGVTYTNTTGKPIQIIVMAGSYGLGYARITVNGIILPLFGSGASGQAASLNWTQSVIIPNLSTYKAEAFGTASINAWSELR